MESKLAKGVNADMEKFRTELEQRKEEFFEQLNGLKLRAKELRKIAENIDERHKNATIANVVGSSAGITGGILSIAGIVCAPFTMGGSLLLTGAGAVMNVAGGATNVGAAAADCSKQKASQKRVDAIIGECQQFNKRLSEILYFISLLVDSSIKNTVADLKISAANCGTKIATASVCTVTAATTKVLSKTVAKKVLRAVSGSLSGVLIACDAYTLVKDSISLSKGSESEVARHIREAAKVIDEEVLEYETIFKKLEEHFKP